VGLAEEALSVPILLGGAMILGGVLLVVRKQNSSTEPI
jgi:LPXTG-motif cell wall-anchored protein